MDTIVWECRAPGCGAFTESVGRDESSRNSVAAFRRAHEAEHCEDRRDDA